MRLVVHDAEVLHFTPIDEDPIAIRGEVGAELVLPHLQHFVDALQLVADEADALAFLQIGGELSSSRP